MQKMVLVRTLCILALSFTYLHTEMDAAKQKQHAAMPIGLQLSEEATTKEIKEDGIDFNVKRKIAVDLVDRAINYMQSHSLDEAFNVFSHSRDFIIGEFYLFVFDKEGICLAHGQQKDFIWKNLWDMRDMYGIPIVQNIINQAAQGGGWITYGWRNATKVSYIKQIIIDGKPYVIGTGYYPHSKEDSVVSLVKGAVALFNQAIASHQNPDEIFALISYTQGRFVLGDLYLYALDFKGKIVAQGDRPGLIGMNAWEVTDERGVKINQEIVHKLQDSAEGIWIEYVSKKADKRAYAEKVKGSNGNQYFIACGYYPGADRQRAVDLVRQGFKFMKVQGLTMTADAINDKRSEQFKYGDLYLEVYALDGKCIAHGNNPDLAGTNFWDVSDEDGKFYVRDLIKKAQAEPGWVDYKLRNLFKSTYVEKVEMGLETYIIACGVYPISKRESAILLVKTAADYLRANPRTGAFHEFVLREGKFIRGDLSIFAFDFNGLCFAYGDDHNLIWRNLINIKDDDGKAFIRLFINTVKSGAGQVTFRLNQTKKVAYLEPVEKDGKSYVIGASYYT